RSAVLGGSLRALRPPRFLACPGGVLPAGADVAQPVPDTLYASALPRPGVPGHHGLCGGCADPDRYALCSGRSAAGVGLRGHGHCFPDLRGVPVAADSVGVAVGRALKTRTPAGAVALAGVRAGVVADRRACRTSPSTLCQRKLRTLGRCPPAVRKPPRLS